MNQKVLATISVILASLLVISIGLLIFFGVQISRATKVKSNEIASSLTAQENKLQAEFQSEKEESLAVYTADEVFGSLTFSYPKVWSTYTNQDVSSKEQLTFLGDPNRIVFDRQSENGGPYTAFRTQIINEKYETKIANIRGKYITKASRPYKESDITVSGIAGKKYQGVHEESKLKYSFIILPLRDKSLYIGTDDSNAYSNNLDTILESFKISK